MKTLLVLTALVAVAVANPMVNIRVNVDNKNDAVAPYPPYPDNPELPPSEVPQPYAAPEGPHIAYPGQDGMGAMVNIEVFIDNQRQDSKGPLDPEPY